MNQKKTILKLGAVFIYQITSPMFGEMILKLKTII